MGATITTIEVEEHTADILKMKAEASGLSLDSYLRFLAESDALPGQSTEMTAAEIDIILDELAHDGESVSPLPASFSREDIYSDHD